MSDKNEKQPIRISATQAKERYDQGKVTILDVVDPDSYEAFSYQIKDAVRIDPREILDHLDRLPKERTVLAYCT